jgi:hypothetical protein
MIAPGAYSNRYKALEDQRVRKHHLSDSQAEGRWVECLGFKFYVHFCRKSCCPCDQLQHFLDSWLQR